jgi:hypothetical protein
LFPPDREECLIFFKRFEVISIYSRVNDEKYTPPSPDHADRAVGRLLTLKRPHHRKFATRANTYRCAVGEHTHAGRKGSVLPSYA